jgi:mannose-6-phosphate isomerase
MGRRFEVLSLVGAGLTSYAVSTNEGPAPGRHRGNTPSSARLPKLEFNMATTDHDVRPWGSYTVVDEGPGHKVKRIVVARGMRLSYQVHRRRSEHWFVIQGYGIATLDSRHIGVQRGVTIDVPTGVAHRIENCGTEDLVFIEVQHGDYFGEDDIIRLEDDFGRVAATPLR